MAKSWNPPSQNQPKDGGGETHNDARTTETDGASAIAIPWGRARRVRAGAIDLLRTSLERFEVVWTCLNCIRRKDHALTTVTGLTAVCPDRSGVVHLDGVGGERGGIGSDGHTIEKCKSGNVRRERSAPRTTQSRSQPGRLSKLMRAFDKAQQSWTV
jgi:hypothetical protein